MLKRDHSTDSVRCSTPVLLTKADSEAGRIEGYGAVFGIIDRGGDLIERGAFADSLREKRNAGRAIPILWQHDIREPIGAWDVAEEDDHGLHVAGLLDQAVQRAREARALVKGSAVTGLSIGYSIPPGGASYDSKLGAVRLSKLDLWEVSVVTFPMNDEARVTRAKSLLDCENSTDCERFLRELFPDMSRSQIKRFARGGYPALAHCDPDEPDEAQILAFADQLDSWARQLT